MLMFTQVAFEVISMVAVVTNCALVALKPETDKYVTEYGSMNVVLGFVAIEVRSSIFQIDQNPEFSRMRNF